MCVEGIELKLALERHLCGEPFDRRYGTAPFLREKLARFRHVAHAQDVDHRVIEHACGRIDHDQDVVAADLEASQILSIAIARESAHARARGVRAFARAFEPARALFERFEIGLQPLDRFTSRKRFLVGIGELHLELFGFGQHALAHAFGAHRFLFRLDHRVLQHHQVLIALEDLLFELLHLGLQLPLLGRRTQAALGIDQHVDEHHRPERAGDAVQEGHAEDFSLAARHRLEPAESFRVSRPGFRAAGDRPR